MQQKIYHRFFEIFVSMINIFILRSFYDRVYLKKKKINFYLDFKHILSIKKCMSYTLL